MHRIFTAKNKMIDVNKYADMKEAGEILELGRSRIYGLVMNGDLVPVKIYGRNFFDRATLQRFLSTRRKYERKTSRSTV
jgi:hypothetical protein